MSKIKFATTRNGDYNEFPFDSQLIILPDGAEYSLRYDTARQALTITKIWGGEAMVITPQTSNQILIS